MESHQSASVDYIVRIASPDDLHKRPKFAVDVDPKQAKPKRILGKYDFHDEIRCGLTCREGHKEGLLVELTDGRETNIGRDCGKKYFGEETMRSLRTRFNEDSGRRGQLDLLRDAVVKIGEYEAQLEALRTDAAWARSVFDSARQALAADLMNELRRRARTGRNDVTRSRRYTKEERDELRDRGERKAAFEVTTVGRIAGLELLAGDGVYAFGVIASKLREFKGQAASAESMGKADARAWTEWFGQVPAQLDVVRRACRAAKSFATPENLKILSLVELPRGAKADLSCHVWDVQKGELQVFSKGALKRRS